MVEVRRRRRRSAGRRRGGPTRPRLGLVAGLAVALVVALLGPITAPAGAGSAPAVVGTVRDAGTGDPVPGALVAVMTSDGTYTAVASDEADGAGAFAVDGLDAGTYLVYAIDPAGAHVPGFFGAPDPVAVAAGPPTAVDPLLAGSRGSLAGTVTEDGTGDPIAGAWVAALDPATAAMRGGAATAADGTYELADLPVGDQLVVVLDPAGAHRPEFHDDATGPGDADVVALDPGAVVDVSPSLAPTTPPGGGAGVDGTVTDAVSGEPVEGAWVVALDAATFSVAAAEATDAAGAYALDLDPGPHLLELVDPTGAHVPEWHPDQAFGPDAAPVPVEATTPPATVDADLTPTRGTLAGHVLEDDSGDPLADAWVVAVGDDGVRATTTDGDGAYAIDGLPAGTYRASALDPGSGRPQEYWPDQPGYGEAEPIEVGAGQTATADHSLDVPTCAPGAEPDGCLPAPPSPLPGPGWSTYTVAQGSHSASVQRGAEATQPLAGLLIPGVTERRFHFAFDSTARYVLTNPTQPEDQYDWSKLPGLSDCGDLDLSQSGFMFGWRWRLDLEPEVLEVTAYANVDGVHLTPPEPLLTMTAEQVDAQLPLWFEARVSDDRQRYEFRAVGPGSRTATTTLPRECAGDGPPGWQWAAGFYFGGTSTAPTTVTGTINEVR